MAAESYAFNLLKEDLFKQSNLKNPKINRTLWLSSQYGVDDLKLRLREDPRTYPELDTGYSDVAQDGSNLNKSLVVGSIVELNKWLESRPEVIKMLKNGFGENPLDLVSGGPPCQSFSMAGLRKMDCEKNSLPWEFAKFVQAVEPKIALLENVSGILRPFNDEQGNNYYAWFEVAKAFAEIGYVPLCLHVNAKLAGVPQNRPRFILLGVRKDFYDQIAITFNKAENALFSKPITFFNSIKNNEDVELDALTYHDANKPSDMKLFDESFLNHLVARVAPYVSVRDAIGDLSKYDNFGTEFSDNLAAIFKTVLPKREMKNHDLRTNNELVRRRFRIYQVLQQVANETKKNVIKILKGERDELTLFDWTELKNQDFFTEDGTYKSFKNKNELLNFLNNHPTKKQTQKALNENQPAPAALSIPDDGCHYHHLELRTLTVREMARIQSFPDSFEFRSKITTGGTMRRFEVPQYTQVGNAVPPLLGKALGLSISELLRRA